ncbi:hypothetical protein PV327_009814 [Microctonus hyperodae]|uniref:Cytochrome c oxidase assembly factor 5 n=1 Tax=Microctonus hyperodae TaxID=165561 RepID=A0AA39KFW4_MICHY|nr:hypothetical protein PV327_009814 [Microctonus hyperodae]
MMRYEEENERLADRSTCAGVRAELKMCLLESDCCKIHKRTPKDCLLKGGDTVPQDCHVMRNLFFECKRSIIDGRRRFRGPKGY